jgi:hypothetical protein
MESAEIDTSVPQSARIWNYWLGGKDNYAVDRAAGDDVLARIPDIADGARAERAYLMRAVQFLVHEAGIRQFLDVGTGLPTLNTPTRWPRPPTPPAGSCTSTTTRW